MKILEDPLNPVKEPETNWTEAAGESLPWTVQVCPGCWSWDTSQFSLLAFEEKLSGSPTSRADCRTAPPSEGETTASETLTRADVSLGEKVFLCLPRLYWGKSPSAAEPGRCQTDRPDPERGDINKDFNHLSQRKRESNIYSSSGKKWQWMTIKSSI